jgi:AcrR family transcriptional regulator
VPDSADIPERSSPWAADDEPVAATGAASYRRSTGSARGQARKDALLRAVVDDLAANGLANYSLRRAARAAGTTHKVLLYHFDGLEDLLGEALPQLRERRVAVAIEAVHPAASLAERVRAVWPTLMDDGTGLRVIDEAIGLALYDPERYAHLARGASESYVGTLETWCPAHWSDQRKREVALLIVAGLRGCLAEWRTTKDMANISPALEALVRALEHEEATDPTEDPPGSSRTNAGPS